MDERAILPLVSSDGNLIEHGERLALTYKLTKSGTSCKVTEIEKHRDAPRVEGSIKKILPWQNEKKTGSSFPNT